MNLYDPASIPAPKSAADSRRFEPAADASPVLLYVALVLTGAFTGGSVGFLAGLMF